MMKKAPDAERIVRWSASLPPYTNSAFIGSKIQKTFGFCADFGEELVGGRDSAGGL